MSKKKLKKFRIEFEYKQFIHAEVQAKSEKAAKALILSGIDNPDMYFDGLGAYSMPSEPDIEFESCVEDNE